MHCITGAGHQILQSHEHIYHTQGEATILPGTSGEKGGLVGREV